MITPATSTPELLTLHAVRLKGMADDAEVAARYDLDPALAVSCCSTSRRSAGSPGSSSPGQRAGR